MNAQKRRDEIIVAPIVSAVIGIFSFFLLFDLVGLGDMTGDLAGINLGLFLSLIMSGIIAAAIFGELLAKSLEK